MNLFFKFQGLILALSISVFVCVGHSKLTKMNMKLENAIPLGISIEQLGRIVSKLSPENNLSERATRQNTYHYFLDDKTNQANIYHINDEFNLVQESHYALKITRGHITLNKSYHYIFGKNKNLNNSYLFDHQTDENIKPNDFLLQSQFLYTYHFFPVNLIYLSLVEMKLNFFEDILFRIVYRLKVSSEQFHYLMQNFKTNYNIISSKNNHLIYENENQSTQVILSYYQHKDNYHLNVSYQDPVRKKEYDNYFNKVKKDTLSLISQNRFRSEIK